MRLKSLGREPSPASAGHTFDEGVGVSEGSVHKRRAAEIIFTEIFTVRAPGPHTAVTPSVHPAFGSQNHNM